MANSRKQKLTVLALAAALVAAFAVSAPSNAATSATITLKVTNWQDYVSEAKLFAAPSKWASTSELATVRTGTYDPDTQTVTFSNVPLDTRAFVGIETHAETLVENYYFGATGGLAYPLAGSFLVDQPAVDLGTIAIPAYGSVHVDFGGASADLSAVRLANAAGQILDYTSLGESTGTAATLDGLVPGTYRLWHLHTADNVASYSDVFTVTSGGEAALTWVPTAASTIAGRVTNGSGTSLRDVRVEAYAGSTLAASTTSTSTGAYSLVGLSAGDYTVRYYTPEVGAAASYQDKAVSITGVAVGATKTIPTVKLATGGTLAGALKFTGSEALLVVSGPDGYGYSRFITSSWKKYSVKGLKTGTYTVYLVDRNTKVKYGTTTVKVTAGKIVAAKTVSASKATITLSGTISGLKYPYVEVRRKGLTTISHGAGWFGVGESVLDTNVGIGGNDYGNSAGKYTIPGLIPGTYAERYCAGPSTGCSTTNSYVPKTATKNFVARSASNLTLDYAGARVVDSRLVPISDTDATGTIKFYWEASLKDVSVRLESDAFGGNTPFYFTLNRATVASAADVATLQITGIGGQ